MRFAETGGLGHGSHEAVDVMDTTPWSRISVVSLPSGLAGYSH